MFIYVEANEYDWSFIETDLDVGANQIEFLFEQNFPVTFSWVLITNYI